MPGLIGKLLTTRGGTVAPLLEEHIQPLDNPGSDGQGGGAQPSLEAQLRHRVAVLESLLRLCGTLVPAYKQDLIPLHSICRYPGLTADQLKCSLQAWPGAMAARNSEGWTGIHLVCRFSKTLTTQLLRVAIEASPDSAGLLTHDGWSPLLFACRYSQSLGPEALELLLQAAPSAAGRVHKDGWTPLHVMCRNSTSGDAQMLRMLLKAHPAAAQSLTVGRCWTPLHCACKNSSLTPQMIALLLQENPLACRAMDSSGKQPADLLPDTPKFSACRTVLKQITEMLPKPPEHLMCPISVDVMQDPVFAADGHTYDRVMIEGWLQDNDTSPKTNLPLENKNLTSNHMAKSMLCDFRTNIAAEVNRLMPVLLEQATEIDAASRLAQAQQQASSEETVMSVKKSSDSTKVAAAGAGGEDGEAASARTAAAAADAS